MANEAGIVLDVIYQYVNVSNFPLSIGCSLGEPNITLAPNETLTLNVFQEACYREAIHTLLWKNLLRTVRTDEAGFSPDGNTIAIDDNGNLSAVTATEGKKGIVQPDGDTLKIEDGVLSVIGGLNPVTWDQIEDKPDTYAPIVGTGADQAMPGNTAFGTYSKPSTGIPDNDLASNGTFVKTSGAQTIADVKTFSSTDVHSAGISVTGNTSKIALAAGAASSTTAGANVKVAMGNNVSGVTPGAGGDLSLILYGSGTAVGDYGLGVTSSSLNVKAGSGAINHFVGNKNVASMGTNGVSNMVLTTQTSGTAPITATTELGIKAFCNSGTNRGFEFRCSATLLWQFVCDTNNFHYRRSTDNGATWTAWFVNCTTENTAWA
jgi:hypothetical protein